MKSRKIFAILCMSTLLCSFTACGSEKSGSEKITEKTTSSSVVVTENSEASSDTKKTEATENSYEHNECYDIVETASYKNSIGYTILIHKVAAKKDCNVDATLLAYDSNGNVIGKSEDKIVLTKGKNNFIRYSFETDISNAILTAQMTADEDSFMVGERNAVEMLSYNKVDNDLFITFKQLTDEIGSFAKFKILFYKEDKIVDTDEGYFRTHAKNLNGKDTTDVASIWIHDLDFDKIEYIFEP